MIKNLNGPEHFSTSVITQAFHVASRQTPSTQP